MKRYQKKRFACGIACLILAVICAGLLIGSSLVCTTDMAGKLFGIPALVAIGFFLALILGLILVYTILRKK